MENAETQEDQMTEETEQKQAPPAINQETPDTLTAGANTEADVVAAAEQQVFSDTCGAANPLTARYCQHCAALMPFRHITGMLVGPTLLANRYQLVSCIGQGGMGAVYKAADTKFNNRPVAIKEMSSAGLPPARVQEAEEAFRHEANLLADLIHPNLPRIYEHFTENERSYLVMDFIEGKTIEEYLEQIGGDPLTVDQVIAWAEELCDVLSYLHSHQPPIIFRDLKPANVMISESGHIFLIDFGIARFFKPGQSHDTVALGSPGYAAPEQYGKAQSTPRTDIYCLGALLHYLLTGLDPSEQPFFFRPASQVNPTVPTELEVLLQKMLEMDADRRPASAQDVLKALRTTETKTLSSRTLTQASVPVTPAADRLLEDARTLHTQNRLDEAMTLYDRALQLDTTNALGWQGRGLTQGLRSRHQDALASFERALQLNPSLVTSWNAKGKALSALHRDQEALVAFERALQLDPNNASAWNNKGAVLSALGRPEQALSAFDKALSFDPGLAQAWNNKGLLLKQQHRYQEALNAFEQALKYDRKIATSWSGKAGVLHEMGRLQEALDAYTHACTSNPALIPAWSGKGSVLYVMGRYKEAEQAYREALNRDNDYAPALYGMGNVLYAQRRLRQALDMLDKATRRDPRMVKAWNRRGHIWSDLGERMRALDSYDAALRIDPRYAPAWHNKAGILFQFRRYSEALFAYEQALSINPNF